MQQLNSLNGPKTAGPDGLHPVIIKTPAENENFVNVVTVLFHISCRKYMLHPHANPWKRAIVTASNSYCPLNDACNYRPISLACILYKVFEQ